MKRQHTRPRIRGRAGQPLAAVLLAAAAALLGTAGAATVAAAVPAPPQPAAAEPGDFAGLYAGAIVYEPGKAELEATVELAVDGQGRLVGTIDMAAFDMLYHPLGDFRLEGDVLRFGYRRFSEVRGPNALFELEARVDDGGDLVGDFLESRGRIPFRFERIGDAGTPRPELPRPPLADLSPALDELRAAFDGDEDKVRVILLLSPT